MNLPKAGMGPTPFARADFRRHGPASRCGSSSVSRRRRFRPLDSNLGRGTKHRGETMSIKLQKDTEKYLLGSIRRFLAENLETEIGDGTR